MPKQTHHLPMIIFMLLLIPGTVFAATPIQTAQQIIILDPGHGGIENGITSPSGLKEKNITLKLAQKTAQILEDHFNVFLTRTSDVQVSAQERMSAANRRQADLFLSIHLHQSPGSGSGPDAFIYFFDLPQPTATDQAKFSPWINSALKHQPRNKQIAKVFSKVFHAQDNAVQTKIRPMPVVLLEGATMPALLLEPVAISQIPLHPARLELIIDEYASLIAKCIDHCFEKQ